MQRLGFLSRLAFICNICLVLAWLMRYYSYLPHGHLKSTIIIAGMFFSFIVNGVVNIMYGILLTRKRKLGDFVPVWLARINFLFLMLQLYLILIG